MIRKLSFLLAFVFLSVQASSLLHIAEYGFKKHVHHGRTCDIYLFFEHQKVSDLPPPITVPATIAFVILLLSISSYITPDARLVPPAKSRAPPLLSL